MPSMSGKRLPGCVRAASRPVVPGYQHSLGAEDAQGANVTDHHTAAAGGFFAASEQPSCRSWVIARRRSVTADCYAGFLCHQHLSGL